MFQPLFNVGLSEQAKIGNLILQNSTLYGDDILLGCHDADCNKGVTAAGTLEIYMDSATPGIKTFSVDGSTGDVYTAGFVGIGTDDPGLTLTAKGPAGAPATSGITQIGIARIDTTTNAVLDMGILGVSPWGAWLQVTDKTNLLQEYPLALNPNGGNVGIGSSNPLQKLEVAGGVLIYNPNPGEMITLTLQNGDNVGWQFQNTSPSGDLHLFKGANEILNVYDDGVNKGLWVDGNFSTTGTISAPVVEINRTSVGGCLIIRDTDDLGWTYCTTLNGSLTCNAIGC